MELSGSIRTGSRFVSSFDGPTNTPGHKVECRNWIEDAFSVTNLRGMLRKFAPSEKGLHHWDCGPTIRASQETCLVEVATTSKNEEKFSNVDTAAAKQARALQHAAGHLTENELMTVVQKNLLLNDPATPKAVRTMTKAHGPSVPGLKGKTVRRGNIEAQETPVMSAPAHVRENCNKLTLFIDIMKVNEIPFLTTLSQHAHFGTATPLKLMTIPRVVDVLTRIIKAHKV